MTDDAQTIRDYLKYGGVTDPNGPSDSRGLPLRTGPALDALDSPLSRLEQAERERDEQQKIIEWWVANHWRQVGRVHEALRALGIAENKIKNYTGAVRNIRAEQAEQREAKLRATIQWVLGHGEMGKQTRRHLKEVLAQNADATPTRPDDRGLSDSLRHLAGGSSGSMGAEPCWCCGKDATRQRVPDPWEGRLDGYCDECAWARCDAYPEECPVRNYAKPTEAKP